MHRRSTIAIALGLLAVLALPGSALAVSPHFASVSTSKAADGDLGIQFKEAGLGQYQRVSVTASGTAILTWGCHNGSGKVPSASNKRTVSSGVSASGSFTAGASGSISGLLVLDAPAAPADFSCPSGQRLGLLSASWADVRLMDTTNNVSYLIGAR